MEKQQSYKKECLSKDGDKIVTVQEQTKLSTLKLKQKIET